MTRFDSYIGLVAARKLEHPEWREGQTFFNVLYFDGYDPAFADEIRGGALDPFHRDQDIPAFLDALKAHWGEV